MIELLTPATSAPQPVAQSWVAYATSLLLSLVVFALVVWVVLYILVWLVHRMWRQVSRQG